MPKSTRRITVTRTVTYTTTLDVPGYPEADSATVITALGGAAGTSGTLALGELLSGSVANNGSISPTVWSASGSLVNIESYSTRVPDFVMQLGQRIASISPPAGYETARSRLFVVTARTGDFKTGASSAEPSWNTTIGGTTADDAITFMAVDKFGTVGVYSAAARTAGTVVKPSSTSLKEFLVTANTTFSGTPTWTSFDSLGQTGGTSSALLCVSGCKTYGPLALFNMGDIVKPSSASSDEYIVTTGGKTDTTASLSASVGSSVTIGTVVFKRIV